MEINTEPPRIIKFTNLDLDFPIQAKATHVHLRKKPSQKSPSPTAKTAQAKQKGISWKLKDLKSLLEMAETKGLNQVKRTCVCAQHILVLREINNYLVIYFKILWTGIT